MHRTVLTGCVSPSDPKIGRKLGYHNNLLAWTEFFLTLDLLALGGYFWPFRGLVRMPRGREYASTERVIMTSLVMVAIIVVMLVPIGVALSVF